jgi:hypothetical protein
MSFDGLIAIGRQIYLLKDKTLKDEVLREAHESRFATHPGSTKMYRDLKKYYWWPNMKREIAKFVSNCGICQQVKIDLQGNYNHYQFRNGNGRIFLWIL